MSDYGDINQFVYRISDQKDLERVRKYGSSRAGISNKIWDKIDIFPQETKILHQDVIIASEWEDLIDDIKLPQSTLGHKLEIYDRPFFAIYFKNKLKEIGHETGINNQGRHYLFLDKKLKTLHSLWQIYLPSCDIILL